MLLHGLPLEAAHSEPMPGHTHTHTPVAVPLPTHTQPVAVPPHTHTPVSVPPHTHARALIGLCQSNKQMLNWSCDPMTAERRLGQLLGDIQAGEIHHRDQCLSADRLQYERALREEGPGPVQGQCLLGSSLDSSGRSPELVETARHLDALIAELQLT